jgi:hypothetical protein
VCVCVCVCVWFVCDVCVWCVCVVCVCVVCVWCVCVCVDEGDVREPHSIAIGRRVTNTRHNLVDVHSYGRLLLRREAKPKQPRPDRCAQEARLAKRVDRHALGVYRKLNLCDDGRDNKMVR